MPWWNPFSAPFEERVSGLPTVEQRDYDGLSVGDPVTALLLGYSDPSGVTVSEATAFNLSGVFRSVSLIAGSIGSLPLRSVVLRDGREQAIRSFLDNPGGERYTPVEWGELSMVHLLLHGTAYLQHITNGAGAIMALYPVHPRAVTPDWDDTRPGGKVFKVAQADGSTRSFDASTMTQIMGVSLDGLAGISAIHAARLSMGTGLAGDRLANHQLAHGTHISGFASPPPGEDYDDDEMTEVRDQIKAVVAGPSNAGSVPVFNRAVQFSPWQLSNDDLQFIQSRTFQIDEIGRWFGVPPHLLGLTEKSTSWGQGIAEQNRGLARYTLRPWTTRIEQRVSRLLPPGRRAQFDYSAFVEPSPEDMIGLLIEQVNSGLLTLNEARSRLNLAPLPGGDTFRLPPGSLTPAQMGAPAEGGTEPPQLPGEGGSDA